MNHKKILYSVFIHPSTGWPTNTAGTPETQIVPIENKSDRGK
jgi:hypothetical protein